MLYVEHNDYKNKQLAAQRKYDEILAEKEKLFAKTLPKGINYDAEKIAGGQASNVFDDYLIAKEKERIDERLTEIKSILDDRTQLLKLKEQELRASKDWHDKIYVYYYLDHIPVNQIKYKIPYSRSQIFNIINIINTNCHIQKSRGKRREIGQNKTINE